jgi:hypothetical protein
MATPEKKTATQNSRQRARTPANFSLIFHLVKFARFLGIDSIPLPASRSKLKIL